MSAIHVVVRPRPDRAPSQALAPLYGLFDVVVDGVNVTARIGDGQALALLAELGHAVAQLGSGRRQRATLQLYAEEQAWELGLEVDGDDVLITVYRGGPSPEVAVFERRVALAALRDAVVSALDEAPSGGAPAVVRASIDSARAALAAGPLASDLPKAARVSCEITPRAAKAFGFAARAELRQAEPARDAADPQLERADLHALLAAGQLTVTSRKRTVRLDPVQLFLFAEQLVALADDVLDAWQTARPLFRRAELGGARIGVRKGPGDGPIAVSVARQNRIPGESVTFPEIEPSAFVRAATRFARALGQAFSKHDPGQARNLRLIALLEAAAALAERVDDAELDDSLTNPEPESYKTFARPARQAEERGRWEHGGKMRFLPRWVATVPNIDLRSTFLCGDTLIVGSARETACIQRSTGHVIWRVAGSRAGCVLTPAGLARIHPDGRIVLHDLATGEDRFTTRVRPREAGGATGAVVYTPGLPKLLVVAEGDRQVTAVDLVTGDIRWRHTGKRPAAYRMRRAGRLLLVAGGDSALVALDVATGEVVWRVRNRLPFSGDITVDHDDAFAIGGAPYGPARLHQLDPWSGHVRWSAELDDRPVVGQTPLVTPEAVVVPVRDRRGVGARAFDRHTGAPLWEHAPGLASPTTAWMAVDGAVVANSAAGTLLCIDVATGTLRFNHVFSRHVDADQPRRLEPVLRSGALFVPQHQVHVVRPKDGEVIGTVPTDLIPDLVRVDEQCNVYVAEESGHVAAFGVAARLTLVK